VLKMNMKDDIKTAYSIIDVKDPVFGKMQFKSLKDAKKALLKAQKHNSSLKIVREAIWH
tara:strand:- start:1727 stop:1903 length:177 start_codon:yes stop_codon:yes gene_type:complete